MALKRLQLIIAEAGIASRRAAETLIKNGVVRVNGKMVSALGTKADPDLDQISVNGKTLSHHSQKRYFIFHKPFGVMTSLSDPHADKTIADYFSDIPERLYPAGRLDQDSTGLLLVSNDGDLVHKLTHPRFGIEKHYVVTIDKVLLPEEIRTLENGIDLDEKQTAPCRIEIINQKMKQTQLLIILHEGKKRQIRRMIAKIGGKVLRLHRNQYGPLTIGNLKPGARKELTALEIARLKKAVMNNCHVGLRPPRNDNDF